MAMRTLFGLLIAMSGLPSMASSLEVTPMVDHDHVSIQTLARQFTASHPKPRARAVAIHDYVRDNIRFGFTPSFYAQKASEVLRDGVGYCNTKSTLFVALLRASGIPARQHFVTIPKDILYGLIDPGTAYVDHSYVEVQLDGSWIATDSYILDRALADRARARLRAEHRRLGYGAHIEGVSEWDGRSAAFSQFVKPEWFAGPDLKDHGIHADVDAFYRTGLGLNRRNLPLRIGFGFIAKSANRRADAIRILDVLQ